MKRRGGYGRKACAWHVFSRRSPHRREAIGRDIVSFVDHISERIMTEPVVKQIVLASRPNGLPTRENFRLEEVPLPMLPEGGLLLRVLYVSLDPYMRGRMDDRKSYAKPVGLGEVMTGESVCEVMTSDQADYALGDIVLAPTGWRTHATSAGRALRKLDPAMAPITGSACSACRASPLTRVST